MTKPNHEARRLKKIENDRLMAFYRAQQNRPYSNAISKRQAKNISSKVGFTEGVYVSRRGFSKYGTPKEKVS